MNPIALFALQVKPLLRSEWSLVVCRLAVVLGLGLGWTNTSLSDDWPGWMGPKRDGVWRETDIVQQFPEDGPEVMWRVPVGPGYTGPAVSNGRVFLMDRLPEMDRNGKPVADDQRQLLGQERVVCFRNTDGKQLWEHIYDCPYKISYPAGPRTTPLIDQGRLYTLGAMGHLFCFEADSGKVLWKKDLRRDFAAPIPAWGWSAHPLIDGDQLICLVGGEGSAVVSFDKQTGRELWRALSAEEIGYAPPVMIQQGQKRQLVIWYDVAVAALDPSDGKTLWSVPFPENGTPMRPAVPIVMPRLAGNRLLVSTFYDGSMLLEVDFDSPAARVLWRADKKDAQHRNGLNALMTTPVIRQGYIYGMSGNGELRCLELETGKLVWRELAPTGKRKALFATSFLVQNDDRFFLFNDQGELILAHLDAQGYREVGRASLLEPSGFARGRKVVWSHPAYADKSIFARNDKELVRVSLSQ